MADDVGGAGAVLNFYGEFLDIGVAGWGLFGDVVCRSFILEDLCEVDRGDRGVADSDVGGCLYCSRKHLKSAGRLLTVKSRIEHFVNPSETDSDDSYQSDQAKIAVAKGGLMGLGPGNSVQRNFLPHPYSDFIFAIIVEEYGLVGAGIVMLLYLIILYRVGVIVRRCTRMFPAILVAGLGLCIVFQALINMGVCVGLFPVTGQPLPLVSMGGTSLLFTSASFGMILSVSHTFSEEGEREEKEKLKMAAQGINEEEENEEN